MGWVAKLDQEAANLLRLLPARPPPRLPRLLAAERSDARLVELPDRPVLLYIEAEISTSQRLVILR